jgi:hypothetical protein
MSSIIFGLLATGETTVEIQWTTPHVTHTLIEGQRSRWSGSAWEPFVGVFQAQSVDTNFVDVELEVGQLYRYRLRTRDQATEEVGPWTESKEVTTFGVTPEPPTPPPPTFFEWSDCFEPIPVMTPCPEPSSTLFPEVV